MGAGLDGFRRRGRHPGHRRPADGRDPPVDPRGPRRRRDCGRALHRTQLQRSGEAQDRLGRRSGTGAAGECPGYGHGAAAGPSARWQDEYRHWRPPVERGIAWRTRHSRRLRYRGVLKNDAWLHTRTAALNLRQLANLGVDVTDGAWAINPATA
ncbi:transposase [Streptomyces celluloflavus]|uniref:transposase n=1 Tax=Streptomyces celluloflavus TaxID=58344 RepID=UPI0036AF5C20